MICFPNCKINLGLYVTNKRSDGYHDLETVFYPLSVVAANDNYLPLRDVLEIVPADEAKLTLSGLAVAGNNNDNLVWKAYQLLRSEFPGKVPALDIYLHKVIPMGAGLGGGSADGSFMLKLINDYCNLGLSAAMLATCALKLGSDCPIFIYNTPMFATGRGEQLAHAAVDLSGFSIQIICPKVHVSTAKAFSSLSPRAASFDLRTLHQLPVADWKEKVANDFETTVFRQHAVLGEIKEQLYTHGALYASMSGTGSAIYGIFRKSGRAQIVVNTPFEDYYIK